MPEPLDPNTPIYLIPPHHDIVLSLKEQMELVGAKEMNTMVFRVQPEMVEKGIVNHVQEFVFAVQHFPDLIAKYVFSCEFAFEEIPHSELLVPEDEWKSEPKYFRWFHRLGFPPILFFIRDRECRFYFLIGDWLAQGNLNSLVHKGKDAIQLDDMQTQQMALRLLQCCRLFKLYCHGTGFDPDPYIEGLIAEFNFEESLLYDEVQKQYAEDVAQGVQIRVNPKTL